MTGARNDPGVSGTIVRGHLDLLASQFGAALVRTAIAELSAEHRAVMESVTAAGFVSIPAYEAFYEAMARLAGRRVPELHAEISRQSVERAFNTIWRVLLRFTSDEALVSRTPLLFSRGYDRGKLTSKIRTPGLAELELTEWPDVPDIAIRGLSVAVETVLRLSRRRSVSIVHQRSSDGATFQATWRSTSSPPR
jgi:hypothetical protein